MKERGAVLQFSHPDLAMVEKTGSHLPDPSCGDSSFPVLPPKRESGTISRNGLHKESCKHHTVI